MTPIDDEPAARLFMSYPKANYELAASLVDAIRTGIAGRWPSGPAVKLWFDEKLGAGEHWDPRVQLEIETADIILFLITSTCSQAGYMWSDEFPIALDRFRAGEGRVRLIPVLYADVLAPIRTHRITRGLNYIPREPHERDPNNWQNSVVESVLVATEAVISQREAPALRLMPAVLGATVALEDAKEAFSLSPQNGYYGSVLASEIHNILGAITLAITLPGRERSRALSVWDPKLRNCLVRLRGALPGHADILRVLRDRLDEVATYSNDEDIYPPRVHTPAILGPSPEADALTDEVRNEISAARQIFIGLSDADAASTSRENDVREYAAEVGDRHAALAEVILDEVQIDTLALTDEINGVNNVARQFAETLRDLGAEASPQGLTLSDKLSVNAARARQITEKLHRGEKAALPNAARRGAEDKARNSNPPRGHPRVFIIDDRDKRKFSLASSLKSMGHDVLETSSSLNVDDVAPSDVVILAQSDRKSIVGNPSLISSLLRSKSKLAKIVRVYGAKDDSTIIIPDELELDYTIHVPMDAKKTFEKGVERVNRFLTHDGIYRAYTTKFDEVVRARDLISEKELMGISAEIFSEIYSKYEMIISNIRNNHLESFLDIGNNTAITLLIDNSGSMRGRPIAITACCATAVAQFFDQVGIRCEVLGFTTRAWKGGRSRDEWRRAGEPPLPGRLNEVRHIVYKDFDESFQEARRSFDLMLREGFLKENIDGEALLWASERLSQAPEKNKVLLVLSDGAPVDDSTIMANTPNLLIDHLKSVIRQIDQEGEIKLMAIGIGHKVGRYYQSSIEIADAEILDDALVDMLKKIAESIAPGIEA